VPHRIEAAKSSRSKCATCSAVIAKGTVRVAEEYRDIGIPDLLHRFYHLRCAAAVHPELVATALRDVEHGLVFDRAELEAKIAPALERERQQRLAKYAAQLAERDAQRPAAATDATTTELLAQLANDPADTGTLAVLADHLQACGDIRGELIGVQLAIAAGASAPKIAQLEGDDDEETDHAELVSDARRLATRRSLLVERLGIQLDPGDTCVWGIGFIKRLELLNKNGTRLAALASIWAHPSVRVLSELRVGFASAQDASWIARIPELVPPTLRRLELEGGIPLVGIAAAIAHCPRLEHLALTGRLGAEPLAHAALRRLELWTAGTSPATEHASLARLSPAALPAVTELALGAGYTVVDNQYRWDDFTIAVASLGAAGWFERLAQLGLHGHAALPAAVVTQLARYLGPRKLARLDLTGTKVPVALRAKLAALCDELIAPDIAIADDQTVYVEHSNKPEWGRGTLVRRAEGKLEVEFPAPIGRKVFKADAPFLKLHG